MKIWDSSLAHIAMLWAKQQGPAALERLLETLYPPFWRRELDIESAEELESMLAAADCDTKGFGDYLHGPGRSAHDQINEAAFDAGIFGVPTYLAGDEMWFGREHLPRVSWLLSGSTGPAPDVANRSFTA